MHATISTGVNCTHVLHWGQSCPPPPHLVHRNDSQPLLRIWTRCSSSERTGVEVWRVESEPLKTYV